MLELIEKDFSYFMSWCALNFTLYQCTFMDCGLLVCFQPSGFDVSPKLIPRSADWFLLCFFLLFLLRVAVGDDHCRLGILVMMTFVLQPACSVCMVTCVFSLLSLVCGYAPRCIAKRGNVFSPLIHTHLTKGSKVRNVCCQNNLHLF